MYTKWRQEHGSKQQGQSKVLFRVTITPALFYVHSKLWLLFFVSMCGRYMYLISAAFITYPRVACVMRHSFVFLTLLFQLVQLQYDLSFSFFRISYFFLNSSFLSGPDHQCLPTLCATICSGKECYFVEPCCLCHCLFLYIVPSTVACYINIVHNASHW